MGRNKDTQIAFTVTLSKELNEQFEAYCKKNYRSKNAQCAFLIEQALKEDEEKSRQTPSPV